MGEEKSNEKKNIYIRKFKNPTKVTFKKGSIFFSKEPVDTENKNEFEKISVPHSWVLNGSQTKTYLWSQTRENITVRFLLPLVVKGSEVQIFISEHNCEIKIKNRTFLQRSFYGPISGPFETEDL